MNSGWIKSKRLPLTACLGVALLAGARPARAGIFDIFNVVVSTITGPIGGALKSMTQLIDSAQALTSNVLYPVSLIKSSLSYVNTVVGSYRGWMTTVSQIPTNSAALLSNKNLEQTFLSGNSGSVSNIGSLYKTAFGAVPAAEAAPLAHRQMADMDDALSKGALALSVNSDQASAVTIQLSQNIEDETAVTAPGTAGMLSANARTAELSSLASQHKVLAGLLRVEAGQLAHESGMLKQSVIQAQQLNDNIVIKAGVNIP